ncbi:MAG: Imm53 family immunity protein [Bacteroidales bacterium]
MSNLFWFQSWYIKHSFETGIEVHFETKPDRGWKIRVNLQNTKYRFISDYFYETENKGIDWYKVEMKEGFFVAEGNFTQLDFLIGKFREMIGEQEPERKKNDNYWDIEIQNFIFENKSELITFLHYTPSKEIANKIVETGFRFYDFDKSAHEAKSQITELNYFHYLHKQFGDFIVVISFSKKLYFKYLDAINNSNSSAGRVEEIFTETMPFLNENSDLVYTLSNRFIKGFFNYYTKEIVRNNAFNPGYEPEKFMDNLKKTMTSKLK